MKIQSRTKLSPTDLLPYEPGRAGASAPSRSFNLSPPDLSPLKPGLSSKSAADAKLGPLDLSTFRPGHPGKAELKPLNLNERPTKLAAGSLTAKSQHDQLTDKTQKWVAQTFFGTLLKQMGDSPFKSELFSGGKGGETFSSLYHQQLADRMARGAGTKLVHSIVKSIEAKQGKEKESGSSVQGSEKKSESRPLNTQDPRTKAYLRSRPSPAKQSTFSLAA
jgi:Rod binding domain-containing protein